MGNDPRRIIVTESRCNACSTHAVHVYHQSLPEMRIEGPSAEQAVKHLADRLTAALDTVSDPSHRETVRVAIDDTRAFLGREGAAHLGRDISGSGTQ